MRPFGARSPEPAPHASRLTRTSASASREASPAPDGSLRTCAWAAVVDADGREGVGGSLAMPLPPAVARLLREARAGRRDRPNRGAAGHRRGVGAVGVLTGGLVDRQRAYEPLVAYALARWLASDWWES